MPWGVRPGGWRQRAFILPIREGDLTSRLFGGGVDDIDDLSARRLDPFAIDINLPVVLHDTLLDNLLCYADAKPAGLYLLRIRF
jgi:hypothetical protein